MTEDEPGIPAISAHGLGRRFGTIQALADVTLELRRGESLALFGPNGAGKTTLVRILTLGLRPSAGSLRVCGLDPRRQDREIRRRIGLVSHHSFLYDDLSARQNLEFFARLYGADDVSRRAEELLQSLGLGARADDAVGTLSRGLLQRASLARALVHEPEIVLLDEPFTGLDPHGTRALCRTLEQLRSARRTVVLTTHELAQGLALCERWLLLVRGRVVAQGRSRDTDAARFEREYLQRLDAAPGVEARR